MSKVLIVDIKSSHIDYSLYSSLPSIFYPFTGNPFGLLSVSKEVKRGSCEDKDILSVIEGLKKEHKINYLIIGLPFFRFTHHFIDLPLLREKEIRTALPFELEKKLPLPVDEYIYDFLTLKKKKGLSSLLTLSIRKQHLINMVEPLLKAEIPLYGITCTFLTMVAEIGNRNRGRAIILQKDGDFIYLACLLDNEVRALRLIKKEEEIVYPFGFEDPSIPRYIIKEPGENPDGELEDYRRIDMNSRYSLPRAVTKKQKWTFNLDIQQSFPELLLSPPKYRALIPRDIRPLVASSLFALGICLFILTDIIAYQKEKDLLSSLRRKLEILKETESLKRPEEELKELNREYRKSRERIVEVLNTLIKIMPKGSVINAISIDNEQKTLEIEGITERSTKVLEALDSSKIFSNISYSGAITVKEDKEHFKFKMEIKE